MTLQEIHRVDLEPLLRSRPDKVEIKTSPEFSEMIRLNQSGLFRIHSVEVGTTRKWRWRFEIVWPAENCL